jgi:hypothetical protein
MSKSESKMVSPLQSIKQINPMEQSILLYTSLFFGIIEITAGILMFINKTMFWGTISYMIGVFFQTLIALNTLTNMPSNTTMIEKIIKMNEKGVFLFIYILLILGVYVATIANSLSNISNNEMPPQWSWYSKIIGVILCIIITPILNIQINSILKSTDTKDNQQKGFIVSHFLLIFVYIQFIISFYYQTDGFTV